MIPTGLYCIQRLRNIFSVLIAEVHSVKALSKSWHCQKGLPALDPQIGPRSARFADKIMICLCCKALYSSWVISEERLTKLDRGLRIQWEREQARERGEARHNNLVESLQIICFSLQIPLFLLGRPSGTKTASLAPTLGSR